MRLSLICVILLRFVNKSFAARTELTADKQLEDALTRKDYTRALEVAHSSQAFENIFSAIAHAASYKQREVVRALVLRHDSFAPEKLSSQSNNLNNAMHALHDGNYFVDLAFLMERIPPKVVMEKLSRGREKRLKNVMMIKACSSDDIFALWRFSSILKLSVPAECVDKVTQLINDLIQLLELHTDLPKVLCEYLVGLM